jgi:hypothetical protein
MLIIALVGAFLLYAALYFLLAYTQPTAAGTVTPLLMRVRGMLFTMPSSTPLVLLKLGIIIFAFYLVMDALFSSYRRRRRIK